MCRHLLLPFLQEARETGALKEAKDKLEKKVEELTWRVQLEKRLRVLFWTNLFFFISSTYEHF
jgi:myosin V